MAKQRSRPTRRRDRKTGGGGGRRKSCQYCRDKVEFVDYKDINALRKFVSDRGKIRSRRITGACRRHQNQIATAVKRARELALLPYVGEGSGRDEREGGGRGGRGGRDRVGGRPCLRRSFCRTTSSSARAARSSTSRRATCATT